MGFLRRIVACCFGLLVLVVRGIYVAKPACHTNDLWEDLRGGCPRTELDQMCSSVLSYATSTTYTTSLTVAVTSWTYLTPHRTKTVKGRTTTYLTQETSVIVTKTLTSTQADKTVTRSACKPTITCGAVTITNSFGPLRDACECIYLPTTTTTTLHATYTGYFPIVYTTTKTYSSVHYKTTTTHPIVTTKVPTLTAYQCKTVPPPASNCSNEQMQVAEYRYIPPKNKPGAIDLEMYKTMKPESASGDEAIYQAGYYYDPYDYSRRCQGTYLNGRGYVYAPQTGFYNWSLAAASNAAWLWIDSYAYSGWNKSNSFLTATQVSEFGGGPWRLIHWEAGTYHAFRFAWFCNEDPFDLYYHLRRPDGLILFGQYSPGAEAYPYYYPYGEYAPYYIALYSRSHNVESNYTVQFGCGHDVKLAPRFPKRGQET